MTGKIIDIHTHGIGRFDTRSGRAEDITGMAELHGRAGVSAIVPTVYSADIARMRSDLEAIKQAMKLKPSKGSARVLGAHLEGPFLNPARAGALDGGTFIKPALDDFMRLMEGYERVARIITIAPELKGALKVIERADAMGMVVSMGHSDATFAEAALGKEAGASLVTHLFNAMPPMHHRETGLAGFALMDRDIYVELICDCIHVSAEMLRLVFSTKPRERIIAVSDSVKGPMRKGGLLQGGGAPLSEAEGVLSGIGIPAQKIGFALKTNASRLLWI